MEDYQLTRAHRIQAAKKSMRVSDADRAEAEFKEYFEAGSSGWTGWDQKFVDFIEENRRPGLIYGTVGDGWHFLFSPSAEKGFWVCAKEGVKGKGFFRPETAQALTDAAVEKGLYTR